jgi:uncharacterized lipoprotein YddW (UPF0748 family)
LYEFRGAWIATVSNIDWPSRKGLHSDQQKEEFRKILEYHKSIGINAVIVQIRPGADTFYPSILEPWSESLSGKLGLAPQPYYDPLKFMIDETHRLGIDFHAWVNPFRVHSSGAGSEHITRIHPEWFVWYGSTRMFNPGIPDVQRYLTDVVREIVQRYDVDAIHFDDYFYPYPIKGLNFPDDNSWKTFGKGLNRNVWRRSNVDSVIIQIHRMIRTEKPGVKFGISPFGIWRNKSVDAKGSNTRGLSNYDDLHADILLWLEKGWIDYVAPQLYWECGHLNCNFDTLSNWWASNNYGKHVYVGHAIYRSKENEAWRNADQIPMQIRRIRSLPGIQGSIFYNTRSLLRNPNGWCDSLRANFYHYPALTPPMHWLDSIAPEPPEVRYNGHLLSIKGQEKGGGLVLMERDEMGNPLHLVAIYPGMEFELDPGIAAVLQLKNPAVAVYDRHRNLSAPVPVRLP